MAWISSYIKKHYIWNNFYSYFLQEPVIVDLEVQEPQPEPEPVILISYVQHEWTKEIKTKKTSLEDIEYFNVGLDLAEDSWIQWKHGPNEYGKSLNNPRPFKNERAGWLHTHWSQDFNDHGYASKPLLFDPCKSQKRSIMYHLTCEPKVT